MPVNRRSHRSLYERRSLCDDEGGPTRSAPPRIPGGFHRPGHGHLRRSEGDPSDQGRGGVGGRSP